VDLKIVVRRAPGMEADPTALLGAIASRVHPALRGLLENVVEVQASAPGLGSPAEFWQAGRLALLGEPVHATPFWSDQGPCAAIEDAWVLSRMMERWEEEPHREFATYERFRRPRAGRLHRQAMNELQVLTLDRPADMWRRNMTWSLTSRFLPEIAMEKLDWLYGYDCIRGFA
jgi:2-polyprenyl-6-methoxyphenol hydroxylase-like FAD-dependent oxidoreductase